MSHSLHVPEAVCVNVSKVRRSDAQHGTRYSASDAKRERMANRLSRSAEHPVVQDIIALYWRRALLRNRADGRLCGGAASPSPVPGAVFELENPADRSSGDPGSQDMNVFLCETGSK
jgi:hypothetical protein